MKNSESYNKWVETAYVLFAEEGPQNFSIKTLARQCNLPRTNFYYYFENKNELIDKVIEFHFETTAKIFNLELENRLHNLIPDLYVIVHEFKLGVQFTKQLFLNREKPACNIAYKKSIAISTDLILPKFIAFSKIDLPYENVKLLWNMLTDTWYCRINFNDYSVDYLCALYYEITDCIMPLIEKAAINGACHTILSTPLSKH